LRRLNEDDAISRARADDEAVIADAVVVPREVAAMSREAVGGIFLILESTEDWATSSVSFTETFAFRLTGALTLFLKSTGEDFADAATSQE